MLTVTNWSTLCPGTGVGLSKVQVKVVPGDTLSGIAARYDVNVDELQRLKRNRRPELCCWLDRHAYAQRRPYGHRTCSVGYRMRKFSRRLPRADNGGMVLQRY